MLYRPSFEAHINRSARSRANQRQRNRRGATENGVVLTHYNPGDQHVSSANDPPPKYTPPPSYSTATGAR
jgi:hypothetical protein